MQEKQKQTYCSRCDTPFECRVFDIEHCQCSSVNISDNTKAFLASTQHTCLCKNCLLELNTLVNKHPIQDCPSSTALIENLHYYIESGYFVFTELYHYLKGTCCKNNCRHCAYGYKKIN